MGSLRSVRSIGLPMTIKPVAPLVPENKAEMLELLDVLRDRVEANNVRAIVAVEVRVGTDNPTILHNAGHIAYAEIAGYLSFTQHDLWAKASGVFEE